jgi:hypothetical protein
VYLRSRFPSFDIDPLEEWDDIVSLRIRTLNEVKNIIQEVHLSILFDIDLY